MSTQNEKHLPDPKPEELGAPLGATVPGGVLHVGRTPSPPAKDPKKESN